VFAIAQYTSESIRLLFSRLFDLKIKECVWQDLQPDLEFLETVIKQKKRRHLLIENVLQYSMITNDLYVFLAAIKAHSSEIAAKRRT